MFESLLALLGVVGVAFVVLVYLEVIDLTDLIGGIFELIGSVLRLFAGALFAAGAFFVWLIRRGREKRS